MVMIMNWDHGASHHSALGEALCYTYIVHWPLSKECFINTFWASHCKVGSIINSNVCHIFTVLALCSTFLVYCRNNYYRSVENPFIVQFYFLDAVSECRLVHILNGESKGGYQVFICIIFYHLCEPPFPFCMISHCLLAAFTCHIIPTFIVPISVNFPAVCVYLDSTFYSGVMYTY